MVLMDGIARLVAFILFSSTLRRGCYLFPVSAYRFALLRTLCASRAARWRCAAARRNNSVRVKTSAFLPCLTYLLPSRAPRLSSPHMFVAHFLSCSRRNSRILLAAAVDPPRQRSRHAHSGGQRCALYAGVAPGSHCT